MEYGESRKQVEYKLSPDSDHDPHISETLRKTKKKKSCTTRDSGSFSPSVPRVQDDNKGRDMSEEENKAAQAVAKKRRRPQDEAQAPFDSNLPQSPCPRHLMGKTGMKCVSKQSHAR